MFERKYFSAEVTNAENRRIIFENGAHSFNIYSFKSRVPVMALRRSAGPANTRREKEEERERESRRIRQSFQSARLKNLDKHGNMTICK